MTRALLIALVLVSWSGEAFAKEYGYRSPGGRRIYDDEDTFGDATNTRKRRFVLEAAIGAGPEGNVAALLGFLNAPIRGIEWYAGVGWEFNPARHYTLSVRYVANIDGYRPYIGLGYMYDDLYVLRTYSHNVFAEIGYSWVIHATYHLTVGVGVRRILHIGIHDDSVLKDEDVDQEFLEEERGNVSRWVPTFVLRFSRAF